MENMQSQVQGTVCSDCLTGLHTAVVVGNKSDSGQERIRLTGCWSALCALLCGSQSRAAHCTIYT